MSAIEIWQYIIIPISASIIGGLITFLGVYITIKFQQKQNSDNTVLLNKPYLKISQQPGVENVSCEHIKHIENINNVDSKKNGCIYSYLIKTIFLRNSSNADCILKEFIIDGNVYSISDVLFLKNEIINLNTTSHRYVNTEKQIKSIYIRADDVLGNIYYFECFFQLNYNEFSRNIIEKENGDRIPQYTGTYIITNISLPKSKEEFSAKKRNLD